MSISISDALRNGMLQGSSLKTLLDGGFLYVYAGPVPANADAALDMVGQHTQLVKVTSDATPVDNGTTGLHFDTTASAGALGKAPSETWAGKINFVGKDAASAGVSPLTATFFRFCAAADNGQGAGGGSTPRIQGTLGTAGADWIVTSVALSDNGSNTFGANTAEARLPAA